MQLLSEYFANAVYQRQNADNFNWTAIKKNVKKKKKKPICCRLIQSACKIQMALWDLKQFRLLCLHLLYIKKSIKHMFTLELVKHQFDSRVVNCCLQYHISNKLISFGYCTEEIKRHSSNISACVKPYANGFTILRKTLSIMKMQICRTWNSEVWKIGSCQHTRDVGTKHIE